MKAITLWQPWASLLAYGAKKYETRSWERSYRGPMAIHAGKFGFGPYACELPIGFTDAAINALWPGTTDPCAIVDNWDEFPKGEIIATAELVGIYKIVSRTQVDGNPIEAAIEKNGERISITGDELLFGDWTPGRYAWEFVNMTMLPEPIPAKGAQGIWNWER